MEDHKGAVASESKHFLSFVKKVDLYRPLNRNQKSSGMTSSAIILSLRVANERFDEQATYIINSFLEMLVAAGCPPEGLTGVGFRTERDNGIIELRLTERWGQKEFEDFEAHLRIPQRIFKWRVARHSPSPDAPTQTFNGLLQA